MVATKQFINEAKSRERDEWSRTSDWGFKRPPRLLFHWSRLFQATVSQAGSYMLVGKFHDGECGIYKSEGGCKISGAGEVVLTERGAYIDMGRRDEKIEARIAELVTAIVFAWDPMDPIESMLDAAAKHIGTDKQTLRDGMGKASCGGAFGGDSLTSFFDWNPFSDPPIDREYQKFCLMNFADPKWTEEQVNQKWADQDLGKELLKKMCDHIRSKANGQYVSMPMCCSPIRRKDGLVFWINTGRQTQIDGAKTRAEIEAFLKSDGKLVDARD